MTQGHGIYHASVVSCSKKASEKFTSTTNTSPAPSQSLAVSIGVCTKQKPSLCTRHAQLTFN